MIPDLTCLPPLACMDGILVPESPVVVCVLTQGLSAFSILVLSPNLRRTTAYADDDLVPNITCCPGTTASVSSLSVSLLTCSAAVAYVDGALAAAMAWAPLLQEADEKGADVSQVRAK